GGSAAGTILNDDNLPSVTVQNAQVLEGNSGTTDLDFPVTLSTPATQTITVNYFTTDGTATADDSDYIPVANGQVTFQPGDSCRSITIQVNGDMKFEQDENFTVSLTNPKNVVIASGGGTATGTIQNDDYPPTISVQGVTAYEGNSGTKDFVFSVSLSNA